MTVPEIFTERVQAHLAAGQIPWRQPWHGGDVPRNVLTGRQYTGLNALLLHCAGFASPYWLTYRQATDLGGTVRPGSKGQPVAYWTWHDDPRRDREPHRYAALHYRTVFNALQVDGLTTLPTPEPSAAEVMASCQQVIDDMPRKPRLHHNASRAVYDSGADVVRLPRPTAFATPAEYYATLYHEFAHATGHASRLGRPGLESAHYYGDAIYTAEELIAEMAEALICGHCGLTVEASLSQRDDAAGWSGLLAADPRLIVTAATHATKAVEFILGEK